MKKQILLNLLIGLAILAGSITSFGQVSPVTGMNSEENALTAAPSYCVPAVPLSCVTNATKLTPIAGKVYNYSISTSANAKVTWIVTAASNVLTGQGVLTSSIDLDGGSGTYILDAEDGVYANSANTAVDIDITWKTFTTDNVLLVAYAVDAAGCTDNIEVWEILPSYGFALEIAGLTDAGASGNSECVSPVQTANYNGTQLIKNYGENWIFFSVNAANWVHSWLPTFVVPATFGTSTIGTVEWAYSDQASGSGSTWHPASDPVLASHYSGATAIGPDGVCIVMRVQVIHGDDNEWLADATVQVGINGNMYNSQAAPAAAYTGYPDLDAGATATDPCRTDVTDTANYTITLRPDVQPATGEPAFQPSSPLP